MPIQLRPSLYQIQKVWKPFCDQWIQKIGFLQTHSLGQWTHQAAHYRPYRSSYVKCHKEPHLYQPTYYAWYIDSYWEMILTPTDSPNWILLSMRHPSPWRPTSSSSPIHLIPAGRYHTWRTFQCASLKFHHNPPPISTPSPALPLNHSIEEHTSSATNTVFNYTFQAFHTLVTRLPPWESLLLQHVCFESEPTQILKFLHIIY
jgi:hypothetical protein